MGKSYARNLDDWSDGPSRLQVIETIVQHISTIRPQFNSDKIRNAAFAATMNQPLGSFNGYYTYYHEGFVIDTMRIYKLRENMRFLFTIVFLKIRIKKVVQKFKERYYCPPDQYGKSGKWFSTHIQTIENVFQNN